MPINPTPQRMTRLDGAVDVSAGVALRGKAKHFAEEIDFVAHNAQGTVLYIDYGAKVAQRNSVEPRSGAYALLI